LRRTTQQETGKTPLRFVSARRHGHAIPYFICQKFFYKKAFLP
jgi:AraC-like DNA-binding protein